MPFENWENFQEAKTQCTLCYKDATDIEELSELFDNPLC